MTEREVLELLRSVFTRAYWRSTETTDAEALAILLKDIVEEELFTLDQLEIQ